DLHGGVYAAWIDNRPGFSVYGMHLDQLGRRVLGWSRDGEPICARIPLTTSAGGTASVSELVLTTVVKSAQGAGNLAAVSSRFDQHPSLRDLLQTSAMVVWADDRSQYGGS